MGILKARKFLLLQEPRRLRSRRLDEAQTAPNQHLDCCPPPHSRVTLDHVEELETESLRWDPMGERLSSNFLEQSDCISIHSIYTYWHPWHLVLLSDYKDSDDHICKRHRTCQLSV